MDPPLPFVALSGRHGVVQGLAPDRLLLRFAGDTEIGVNESETLDLALNGSFIRLTASLTTSSDHSATCVGYVGPEGRATLTDLLSRTRKDQHITICATQDVEASDRSTGLEEVLLAPCALPEFSWDEIDPRQTLLGREFRLPFLITGMTGGVERGAEINRRLARAAAEMGIPMGVGSQRLALENREHEAIFSVKKDVPDVFLIGNLGIAQLRSPMARDEILRAVEMIEADAMAIHLNVLQELVQPEGDRDFRGLVDRLHVAIRDLPVPVIVKEVGAGLDVASARRLLSAGVAALDVGGKGGTSWSWIEGKRSDSPVTRALGAAFRDFGIPTGYGLALLREEFPSIDLVATGGMRDGLQAAKALGLGATMIGVGLPFFRAALESEDGPFQVARRLETELKTAMMVSGVARVADLRNRVRKTARFEQMKALYR